jgi:hypothetical protein
MNHVWELIKTEQRVSLTEEVEGSRVPWFMLSELASQLRLNHCVIR